MCILRPAYPSLRQRTCLFIDPLTTLSIGTETDLGLLPWENAAGPPILE